MYCFKSSAITLKLLSFCNLSQCIRLFVVDRIVSHILNICIRQEYLYSIAWTFIIIYFLFCLCLIVLCRCCSVHSQKQKILYLSINRSRTIIFHYIRNCTYELATSILSWLEHRKHCIRCLSVYCSKTLITLFVKFSISSRWRTRQTRRLIRLIFR